MLHPHVSLSSVVALFGAAVVVIAGCPAEPTGPTYHQDTAALFARECVSCHQQGGIGPFPLTTLDEVKQNAIGVRYAIETRTMPPQTIDNSGDCHTWQDARWLSDDEIALLSRWFDDEMPAGTEEPAPQLEQPLSLQGDAVFVEMAEPYTPVPSAEYPNDDYRCFFLDPELDADAYFTGYEIFPGVPEEVHHMLLFSILSDESEERAQQLDDEDPAPGWTCFGAAGVDDVNMLTAWAPGQNVLNYPPDTGVFVPGGRRLVMQIHYNLLAGAAPDQTALNLAFTPSVQLEAALAPLADNDMELPPGQAEANVNFSLSLLPLQEPLKLWGVFPHMHTLGRTLRFERAPLGGADDEVECLADVPRWDFHWQQVSFYEDPIQLTSEDVLRVSCSYDTTTRDETVFWGEGTQDEMCLVFVYITREVPGPLAEAIDL